MHALTWPLIFVYFTCARCTPQSPAWEGGWSRPPPEPRHLPPSLDDTTHRLFSLLHTVYPLYTSAEMIPSERAETVFKSTGAPKMLVYPSQLGMKSTSEGMEEASRTHKEEEGKRRRKRSVDSSEEEREGVDTSQAAGHRDHPSQDDNTVNDTSAWWWPFVSVRRSPFSPQLGKLTNIIPEDFDYDDESASPEYLEDDLEDYLQGEVEAMVWSPQETQNVEGPSTQDANTWFSNPRLDKRAAASPDFTFSPRLGKKGDFAFSPRLGKKLDFAFVPRLGKKADFQFSPRLGKKADFAFSPRLGKKADFAFSPRLGKKADFAFSPRLGKKADFAFSPRLGKKADFAFSPRLGKKADFAFSPRLGKKADFAFSPRLGKKADFQFSPRLGKKADFQFSPRLGKKADFAFSPRLGKRDGEETSDDARGSITPMYVPRPGRPYFSPRLG